MSNTTKEPTVSELPYTPDVRFDDLNGAVKIELHLPVGSLYLYTKIVDRAEGMVPRFSIRLVRENGTETTSSEACDRYYAIDFLRDVAHLTRGQASELIHSLIIQALTVYRIGVSASILGEVK